MSNYFFVKNVQEVNFESYFISHIKRVYMLVDEDMRSIKNSKNEITGEVAVTSNPSPAFYVITL